MRRLNRSNVGFDMKAKMKKKLKWLENEDLWPQSGFNFERILNLGKTRVWGEGK